MWKIEAKKMHIKEKNNDYYMPILEARAIRLKGSSQPLTSGKPQTDQVLSQTGIQNLIGIPEFGIFIFDLVVHCDIDYNECK